DPPTNWQFATGHRQWYAMTKIGIEAAAKHAVALAADYDVYMGVLPRNGRGGTAKDVPIAGCLWADVDGSAAGAVGALELVRDTVRNQTLPAPHILNISGGGVHCYWLLSDTVAFADLEARFRFKMLLKRLVHVIGGEDAEAPHADGSRADVASILR